MSSWSTWATNFGSDRSGSSLTGRRCEGDDGMVSVFVAMAFTVLLMFTALVIDGGIGYQSHRQSQNAADAGAMAGARALDHVKFYAACSSSSPAPTPCTNYTGASDIKAQVLAQARNSGADTNGVSCWFVRQDFSVGIEFCNTVTLPDPASLAQYSGVKVSARITKSTNFAKSAGLNTTVTTSTATAFLWNFGGGTGSPFIICGTLNYWDSGDAIDWGYPILKSTANGDGTYTYSGPEPAAINKYYLLQGAQTPDCGNTDSAFKGKGGVEPVGPIPTWSAANTGNGQSAMIEVDVAGIKPCPPDLDSQAVDGCGMVLPIADKFRPVGNGGEYHIVSWLAFQVWGSGTGNYNFNLLSIPPNTLGTSCKNPYGPPQQMKYCGKLLGAVTITGGVVAGPATAGSSHVIRLIE